MTHNEAEMKLLDKKLVEVYEVKAFLDAIDAINKIPDDGCPYPELVSEGYSLARGNLWEMIKSLEYDDLGLYEVMKMTEQKKKEPKKAPKNKALIQILKTILFSVIGGTLGSLITFCLMSR